MSISAAISASLYGMQTETRRLSTAAHNIASAGTSTDSSNIDLAGEMLDVLGAEQGFRANASVFETGADMWDVLLTMVRD